MQTRPANAPVSPCETINEVHVKRVRVRPKKTLRETIRKDMTYMTIRKHMISDRIHWKQLFSVANVTWKV